MRNHLGLISIVLCAIFLASPLFQSFYHATLFSLEFLPNNKFKPLNAISKEPLVDTVTIPSGDRSLTLDIWRPDDIKKHPAAIVAYGVDISSLNPETIKLSNALARLGYVVVLPNVPGLLETRYTLDEVKDFITIFNFTREQLAYVDSKKVGFLSFCIGSSVAVLASEDARIADNVHYISVIAIVFDIFTLSRDVSTEQANDAQPVYSWNPHPKTRQVLYTEFADFLPKDEQEKLLQALNSSTPPSKEELELFSTEAQNMYRYLTNKDPQQSKELWDMLSQGARDKLAQLSPKTNIDQLRAKTFVMMYGRDRYLPHTESLQLVNSLPKDQVVATDLILFDHDKFVAPKNFFEGVSLAVKLIRHVAAFFNYTS